MQNEVYQLLLTGGAIGILYAVYLIVKVIFDKKKNTDANYSKQMAREIGIISENHLNHIEQAIREQTADNSEWHRKQYEILCQIVGKIH